jgi:ribonucleoside-diphosphate reductase alpha chain
MNWIKNIYSGTFIAVDQGGNKRSGACAVYLQPWHADIEEFVQMQSKKLVEHNIFPAVWVPDLFMRRVFEEEDADWSLFCPNDVPGLPDTFDDRLKDKYEFTTLYEEYERRGLARQVVKARYLWDLIIGTMMETQSLYILAKDAGNSYSNQVYTNWGLPDRTMHDHLNLLVNRKRRFDRQPFAEAARDLGPVADI